MGHIETRSNVRTGTAYRVRFRHDGKNKAETFGELADAEQFNAMLAAVGPDRALAALEDHDAPRGRTVAEQVRRHVDHLTGVTNGTKSDYYNYLEVDIAPRIGDKPLAGPNALTREDVAVWVNWLATERPRPLSGKSIRNRHALLSAAMTSALRERLIDSHPCEGMRLPRTSHLTQEMVMLTRAEFMKLLSAVDDHWRPLLVTLVGTGIRWGEATALMAGDVDLANGTARIRQAWKHTDGHEPELGTPKSKRSVRTIELEPGILALLRPLVEGRPAGALVFTNLQGRPIRQNTFHGQVWTPAVRHLAGDTFVKVATAGRPRTVWTKGPGKRPRPHDLRHTYASWAIASQRVPMAAIQRSMGHESITTTIDVYGHLQRAEYQALAGATTPLAALD